MPTRGKSNPRSRRKKTTQPAPRLSLTVQYASRSPHLPSRYALRRWAKAALRGAANITVRIVDAAEARALNRRFRRKDYATNVLSFVYDAAAGQDVVSGDIVLCAAVIEREARQQGKPLRAHYAHLTVHGALHLQGYDHARSREAKVMEQLEIDALAALGYTDPYQAASL